MQFLTYINDIPPSLAYLKEPQSDGRWVTLSRGDLHVSVGPRGQQQSVLSEACRCGVVVDQNCLIHCRSARSSFYCNNHLTLETK